MVARQRLRTQRVHQSVKWKRNACKSILFLLFLEKCVNVIEMNVKCFDDLGLFIERRGATKRSNRTESMWKCIEAVPSRFRNIGKCLIYDPGPERSPHTIAIWDCFDFDFGPFVQTKPKRLHSTFNDDYFPQNKTPFCQNAVQTYLSLCFRNGMLKNYGRCLENGMACLFAISVRWEIDDIESSQRQWPKSGPGANQSVSKPLCH